MKYAIPLVFFLLSLSISTLNAQVKKPSNSKNATKKVISTTSAAPFWRTMPGYSEMREVAIWVQTNKAAQVQIAYWPEGKPDSTYYTATKKVTKEKAYTATLIADEVLPGKKYNYSLKIDGKTYIRSYPLSFQSQALWQQRQPAPDFKFAVGSCTYINEPHFDRPLKKPTDLPYGGGYEILETIAKQQPDFMLWGGDNIYLREPDWGTRTGIYHRNSHARSIPEMEKLLATTHHYAIWDDHDYGPNDADRSFVHKQIAYEAFQDFWPNLNTNATGQGGITGTFMWNDVQFFLLDDRWFRAPNKESNPEKDYFGKAQINWLLDQLEYSNAPFKIIVAGGQILSSVAKYENYATYPKEREYLIAEIARRKIKGILFISGDRHHTELTKLDRPETYPLYDLTCSPLTSTANIYSSDEGNTNRIAYTYINQRNFGLIEVKGDKENRSLIIHILDNQGKQLWERTIKANELK